MVTWSAKQKNTENQSAAPLSFNIFESLCKLYTCMLLRNGIFSLINTFIIMFMQYPKKVALF